MASALIEARGRAAATLRDPILILPSPTRQSSTVGALPHPSFTSDAVPKKRAAAAAPANASKAKKQRASTGSAKKSKPSSSSSTETPTPSPPQLDFDLAPDTPVDVRRAIETIYVKASAAQRAPYQLVFPWEDQHAWYDPEEYTGVHAAHWRFWNAFRATFLEWALHAPLATSSAQAQRRKRKMAAIRERLCFISLCLETWGYFNFLRRLEAPGNGNLMWWGGQAGRRTNEAKGYTCSPIRDLMDLYENDHGEYRRNVRDALKPFEIDSGSFETLPELLEKTDALDPDLVENDKRLSDRALARVVLDITSVAEVPDHWVPTLTKGVWRKLVDDKRIKDLAATVRKQLEKGEYELPLVPEFNPKEAKTKGFAPFLRLDGTPTVAGPVTVIDDDDPKYRKTPDEEEAEQLADSEAKAVAKEASSAESLSEGELEADQDEEDDEE
ncbi:hypothetical protein PF011_g3243 [Phytophthora fragariae]|uniref:Uncharacterized protein n=5 Tax=Phytophthora TaxID=4783 RepID=A0A6A3M414_9STRA|nr:hypothetical protein PF011_g3243 [Phytophthora fragariae]